MKKKKKKKFAMRPYCGSLVIYSVRHILSWAIVDLDCIIVVIVEHLRCFLEGVVRLVNFQRHNSETTHEILC